jgi:hypothetical protein
MRGNCRLFQTEDQLRESHIYPKFAVDYFKKTGSRFIRTANEPNRRKQDAFKFYMLSGKAEQRFGDREKWFSQKVFYPHQKEILRKLQYDENLYYFSTSFLWRVLLMTLEHSSADLSTKWYYKDLLETQEKWRNFLAYYHYPVGFDRIYMHLSDEIVSHNLPFSGVDYYFTRMMDATVVSNESQDFLAVYGKFLKFIFWGIIKGGNENELKSLRINPVGGIIDFPQTSNDRDTVSFYLNRIEETENLPKANKKQQDLIMAELLKDKERFIKSDGGRAIINDINLTERIIK